MNQKEPESVLLSVDNDGAISTAETASINQRNKHIDFLYHFVRDALQTQRIKIQRCDSQNQAADPLTKPLDRILFEKLRLAFGIRDQPF